MGIREMLRNRKKHQQFISRSNDRFNMIFLELCIQWFIIFCVVMLWDRICQMMLWHYNPGIGPGQVIVAIISGAQVVRYARHVKR